MDARLCMAYRIATSSLEIPCSIICIMISLYLLKTLPMSFTASLFPMPISFGPKYKACPPKRKKPVSKETLVRAEGFAKIIASDLP